MTLSPAWEALNRMIGGTDYLPSLKFLNMSDPASLLAQYGLNPDASNARVAYSSAIKAGALPYGWSSATGQPGYYPGTTPHVPLTVTGHPFVPGNNGPNTFFPPNGTPPPPGPRGGPGGPTVTPVTNPPPAPVGGHGVIGTGAPPSGGGQQTSTFSPAITPTTGTNTPPTFSPVATQPVTQGANNTQGSTTNTTDFGKLFNPTGYDGNQVDATSGMTIQPPDGGQPTPGQVDFNRLFNPTGYDGTTVGYDAADYLSGAQGGGVTGPTMSGVMPTGPNMAGGGWLSQPGGTSSGVGYGGPIPGANTMFPPNPGTTSSDPSTMPGGFPTGAQTLGQPMYPWLSPYNGDFTATMTPYENQALNGISGFVGGGENLGGAQGYLSNVLSGQYLDPSTNPNLAKYVSSLSGIHDYQDELERERIGSSMAAGGNALSGARAMAESQYQNESNNQYQNMISSMLNSDYQMERGLQNSAVPLQMGLSNELMGGYNNLMGAGAVPRNIQQSENNAEYQDWLRQISGMQQAFQQPENTMLSLLHSGYPGSSQQQYQGSDASSLLAALLGNGGSSSGLLNALFGSGTTGGSSSGGLLGSLGSLLGLGGSSGGSQDTSGQYDPNNPFGFSSNGQDLSSLMGSGYDPNNPFGFSSGGENLNDLLGMYGDTSATGSSDPWAALDQWYQEQQNQGNP